MFFVQCFSTNGRTLIILMLAGGMSIMSKINPALFCRAYIVSTSDSDWFVVILQPRCKTNTNTHTFLGICICVDQVARSKPSLVRGAACFLTPNLAIDQRTSPERYERSNLAEIVYCCSSWTKRRLHWASMALVLASSWTSCLSTHPAFIVVHEELETCECFAGLSRGFCETPPVM
jgi:hypothetical protein